MSTHISCSMLRYCVFVLILLFLCCLFFFFKQKTAYEMRISDWSSDVCSSDLLDIISVDDLDGVDINGTTISATNGSVAKLRQLAVMANVTYDIPLGGNTFKPYVGVGLGAVGSHLKALGEDDGSVRFAWQLRAGA